MKHTLLPTQEKSSIEFIARAQNFTTVCTLSTRHILTAFLAQIYMPTYILQSARYSLFQRKLTSYVEALFLLYLLGSGRWKARVYRYSIILRLYFDAWVGEGAASAQRDRMGLFHKSR